ncbi:MAG: vanadium-dependent haloperoxidase [Acidobacteriota bacterium]
MKSNVCDVVMLKGMVMTMKGMLRIVAGLVAIGLFAAAAHADEVTDWNQTMLRASLVAGSTPLAMYRISAIVQASVFDAVNGIEQRYAPIHVPATGPAHASRRAAVVQAAYVALVKLYPAQVAALDARRVISLASIAADESGGAIASGIAWGENVANLIWAWRLTDGIANTTPSWPGDTTIGQWRPTPNAPYPGTSANGAGYPQVVFMTPWVIVAPSQFRPGPPPPLMSALYARDYNETKSMGSLSSSTRTSNQTTGAFFWNASTASYLWNQLALSLIEARDKEDGDRDDRGPNHEADHHRHRSSLLHNARILGTLDVAMADAAIGCWDAKYAYNYWRPITAIRETADDGNAATAPDPAWTPLFATPPFPEYPSGHSCVSGAAAAILAHEFGEKTPFRMESDVLLGVTRSFRSFSAALDDVKDARVFAGIHFRTATEVGQALGAMIGRAVLENAFNRVREN